jgi:2-oxoisovalerate dehydrogenase E2 component (dihydrolipoyl transacylase)
MYVFELPEIGEGVVEGEIVQWLAGVGEFVDVDQPLCEVMTDKANVEISSPKAGVVKALHGEPGDIVAVHTPLVDIDTDASAGTAKAAAKPTPKAEAKPAPKPTPKAEAKPTPKAKPAPTAPSAPTSSAKTLATPAVRAYARLG